MNWKLEVLSLRRSSVTETVFLVRLMCGMIRPAMTGNAKNVLYYEEQAGTIT